MMSSSAKDLSIVRGADETVNAAPILVVGEGNLAQGRHRLVTDADCSWLIDLDDCNKNDGTAVMGCSPLFGVRITIEGSKQTREKSGRCYEP
jgi:hypothetical protein